MGSGAGGSGGGGGGYGGGSGPKTYTTTNNTSSATKAKSSTTGPYSRGPSIVQTAMNYTPEGRIINSIMDASRNTNSTKTAIANSDKTAGAQEAPKGYTTTNASQSFGAGNQPKTSSSSGVVSAVAAKTEPIMPTNSTPEVMNEAEKQRRIDAARFGIMSTYSTGLGGVKNKASVFRNTLF